MPGHRTANREQWLAERLDLLEAEKAYSRDGDALTARREALPWVRIDKEYRFATDNGPATLAELFCGRSQLMMYHFMFGPDYDAGCASCSSIADGFNGVVAHLEAHDVAFTAVSRAPLAKLQAYRRRMGWSFPWASSFESDFNFDFGVSFTRDEQRDGLIFNYQREAPLEDEQGRTGQAIQSRVMPEGPALAASLTGTDLATYARERMGVSSFAIEDGVIYHHYSSYARGVDAIWAVYGWLDRAPKGRNEDGYWWRRHDEYGAGA